MPGIVLISKGNMVLLLLVLCISKGYARGNTQAEEKKPLNGEWMLAITAFDVSALPSSQQSLGDVMARNLMESLKTVSYRSRVSEEHSYYTDYAWSKERTAAAKNLAAKREKRDALLFQGDPQWKYRKDLKAVEAEIKEMEKAVRLADDKAPIIAAQPVFKFVEDNNKRIFPAPPKTGGEYRFCVAQKADAFLTGELSSFHGRLYLKISMYVLYMYAFQYEDSIIFSIEDTAQAVEELAGRLVTVVSGNPPAALVIHGNPEDALVLINGAVAGRGEIGPLEYPPGSITIESFTHEYQTLTMPLELNQGELAELYINLQPLSREAFTLTVPNASEASVYQGALYLGQSPLQVEVPANQLHYFQVETAEGQTASVIVRGANDASISIEEKANDSQAGHPVPMKTSIVHNAEEKRVEKSRKLFYGAYGRFWIALPIAYVIYGVSTAQTNAYNRTGNADMYDPALRMYYISLGTMILAGAALTETFYRIFRYITTGTEKDVPLVK